MKIATFNVENMFRRAVVLNQDSWSEGKPVLEAYSAGLVGFKHTKGSLHFSASQPLPDGLVADLVRERVAALDAEDR